MNFAAKSIRLLPKSLDCFLTKSHFAQYPTYYLEPVFRKCDQAKLYETNEIVNYINMPIKAPKNNETCSFTYDPLVRLFINNTMKGGDKEAARLVVEKAFYNVKRIQVRKYWLTKSDEAKASIDLDPFSIFNKAIANIRPVLTLQPIKRGAIVYQVPVPVSDKTSIHMAMKWLIEVGRDKKRQREHFDEKVAGELIDAAENRGFLVRRKQELHRQCEANRAYAHFRWV